MLLLLSIAAAAIGTLLLYGLVATAYDKLFAGRPKMPRMDVPDDASALQPTLCCCQMVELPDPYTVKRDKVHEGWREHTERRCRTVRFVTRRKSDS